MTKKARTVEEILREAAAAVTAAKLPKDLQSVAFGKAVDLITGTSPSTAPPDREPARQRANRSQVGDTGPTDDPIGSIANALNLDRDIVDETFHIDDDGEVKLSVASRKLESEKSKATRQLALLVTAARQAASIEKWTTTKTIREVAKAYGKFDGANFGSTVATMENEFSFDGAGQGRKVKMRRDGYKAAADLVERLQGVNAGGLD